MNAMIGTHEAVPKPKIICSRVENDLRSSEWAEPFSTVDAARLVVGQATTVSFGAVSAVITSARVSWISNSHPHLCPSAHMMRPDRMPMVENPIVIEVPRGMGSRHSMPQPVADKLLTVAFSGSWSGWRSVASASRTCRCSTRPPTYSLATCGNACTPTSVGVGCCLIKLGMSECARRWGTLVRASTSLEQAPSDDPG